MKNKKKKLIIIILLLAIISGIYFHFKSNKNPDNELTIYGNVEIRQVDLSFQVAGQIAKMLKEEGDEVNKGDLIAILDNKDYVANLEKATAQVAQTTAIKANADDVYNRKQPLCSDDTVSKTECEATAHQKNEAEANLKAAIAQENFTKNQLDYTKLYAPEKGIVMTRVQEPGATVIKGQTVYTISKSKPIWIRTYISEQDLGNIHYDMKAKVLTDSVNPQTGKKREYIGRIGYISPTAEFTPKTVQTEDLRTDLVYRIRVYIDEPDEFLRQGMPTTIKIDLIQGQENK